MEFKPFWKGLDADGKEAFAQSIGSTVGTCHQIAYGEKRIELGLADVMVAQGGGKLTLAELPLTDRAVFQNKARTVGKQRPPRTPTTDHREAA